MQRLQTPLGLQSPLLGSPHRLGCTRPVLHRSLLIPLTQHQTGMPLVTAKQLMLGTLTPLVQASHFLSASNHLSLNEWDFELPPIEPAFAAIPDEEPLQFEAEFEAEDERSEDDLPEAAVSFIEQPEPFDRPSIPASTATLASQIPAPQPPQPSQAKTARTRQRHPKQQHPSIVEPST
ncbi:hypothetical protein IQ268_30265, partial [Oculatella sp. LEGE 06141]|uniref:hypothetical protein n=1 Tax=Oculatella sp. LEGE 06141 TaxID=1828648 RepID=UPI001A09C5FA